MSENSTEPKVFISYSHDSDDHREWVRKLAEKLRANGVDAMLDQWDLDVGQDLAHFMEQGIQKADRVVMICSSNNVAKADSGARGVGYEKMIVTKEIVANLATEKFLPVLRNNSTKSTPACLGTRKYIDFNDDAQFAARVEDLLRAIHEAPRHPKPPLGANPFVSSSAGQIAGIHREVLKDPWFAKHRAAAVPKVMTFSDGIMEVAFGARDWTTQVDQKTLLGIAERASIHTFGWPIGVSCLQTTESPDLQAMAFSRKLRASARRTELVMTTGRCERTETSSSRTISSRTVENLARSSSTPVLFA